MGLGCIPEPYKSVTATTIEDDLGRAVIEHVDARGITAVDIQRRYSTVRADHLARLRRGEPLNFRVLSAIIEALGGKVTTQVRF
ncbi:hypothetical protein [Rhizobium leguminosarum]|uniref:hypothetical protein n=1 Tax=Rhizobium leguminosarum TaxID=384 RepID=UPI0014427532|nr:hypothetical protein [Rhizobium leguminosarum]NKL63287.1 hypothetical protein [Rhizobium leguminosarum bv. viciae]